MSEHNLVLITGAAGFVGRRLAETLRDAGANVATWTRDDGNLCDTDLVRSALGRMRPTLIYHLASQRPMNDAEGWRRIADEQQMLSNLAYSMPAHGRLIYSGSMFPQWKGDALIPALSGQALIHVKLAGDHATGAEQWDMGKRIRAVDQGPDGAVYLLEDEGGARLLRLTPSPRS